MSKSVKHVEMRWPEYNLGPTISMAVEKVKSETQDSGNVIHAEEKQQVSDSGVKAFLKTGRVPQGR